MRQAKRKMRQNNKTRIEAAKLTINDTTSDEASSDEQYYIEFNDNNNNKTENFLSVGNDEYIPSDHSEADYYTTSSSGITENDSLIGNTKIIEIKSDISDSDNSVSSIDYNIYTEKSVLKFLKRKGKRNAIYYLSKNSK